MPGDYFILDGREPVEVSMMQWAQWKTENPEASRVAYDKHGGVAVSTVFLGMNHAFTDGAPLIFETMIFGGDLDGEMDRYTTYDEAEAGHRAFCERVFGFADILEAEYIEV